MGRDFAEKPLFTSPPPSSACRWSPRNDTRQNSPDMSSIFGGENGLICENYAHGSVTLFAPEWRESMSETAGVNF